MQAATDRKRAVARWLMSGDDHELADVLAELLSRPAWMARGVCVGWPISTFVVGQGGDGSRHRSGVLRTLRDGAGLIASHARPNASPWCIPAVARKCHTGQ